MNPQHAVKTTILIKKANLQGPFITPPECQGQMVTRSFACTEDYIIAHTCDQSDRTDKVEAYHWPAKGEFSPQNQSPKLGRLAGTVWFTP